MALSSNLDAFKVQTLENILAQTAAPIVPEWPSNINFREVIQNPHFLKKSKGGTKRNFFKNRPKSKPRLKCRKALLPKWYYPLIIMHLGTRTGEDFGANSGFKSARMAKLWQFSQGHPKPAFSEKVQRGEQEKFFKNRPKSSPRLKGLKALWRKWHYPLTSMLLRCKD